MLLNRSNFQTRLNKIVDMSANLNAFYTSFAEENNNYL